MKITIRTRPAPGPTPPVRPAPVPAHDTEQRWDDKSAAHAAGSCCGACKLLGYCPKRA